MNEYNKCPTFLHMLTFFYFIENIKFRNAEKIVNR